MSLSIFIFEGVGIGGAQLKRSHQAIATNKSAACNDRSEPSPSTRAQLQRSQMRAAGLPPD
jgi:hypothetical protein